MVQELLSSPRVNVNAQNVVCPETPLHEAIEKNHIDIVKLLLQHPDIDVNQKGYKGASSLHLAVVAKI